MNLKPGWLQQFDNVSRDTATWPEWMRREAGFKVYKESRKPNARMTTEEALKLSDRVEDEFGAFYNAHHVNLRLLSEILIVLTQIREVLADKTT